jgi:hypothetical protein
MGHRAYHLKVQSLRKCGRRGRQATSGIYSVSVRLKVFMGKSCIKIGGEGIVTQGEFLVKFCGRLVVSLSVRLVRSTQLLLVLSTT